MAKGTERGRGGLPMRGDTSSRGIHYHYPRLDYDFDEDRKIDKLDFNSFQIAAGWINMAPLNGQIIELSSRTFPRELVGR